VVALKLEDVLKRLRDKGGHVFLGEYRGSVVSQKDVWTGSGNDRKKSGDRYLVAHHAVEIVGNRGPETTRFEERIEGCGLDVEAGQRLVESFYQPGEKVCIVNPNENTFNGKKYLSFKPGEMIKLA